MNSYYLELGLCNNYQDVLNIISRINTEIEYCMKVGDNSRLIELKQVLTQINVVANYIIKKRFEIVMPMLIEERKEMLTKLVDEYTSLYEKLDKLYLVNLGNDREFDELPEFNEWIGKLFSLYEGYGYQVTINDFTDIFDKNASDYKTDNYIVFEYMKLIFENRDELDSQEFAKLIFRLVDEGIIKEIDAIPVIDIVKLAIRRFNNRHKELISKDMDEINKISKSLNIGEINSSNVSNVRRVLEIQIEDLNEKLDELEKGDNSFIKSSYEDRFMNQEELDVDIEIHNFCNFITNNGYSSMDIETKDEFFKDLYKIMDIIVKLRIFGQVSSMYDNYSKRNRYLELSSENNKYLSEYDRLKKDLKDVKLELVEERNKIKKVPFAKLIKDRSIKLEQLVKELENNLVSVDKKLKECMFKKGNYIVGFVNEYNLTSFGNKYNILGLDSVDKLFGVFKFEMLPPNSDKVSEMKLFKKYGIKLPSMDSSEFKILSNRCLEFINNSMYIRRKNVNLRSISLANDRTLDDIASNKFDYLIDTVSTGDIENSKKRR